MNREEFRKQVKIISKRELMLKENDKSEEIVFQKLNELGYRDKDGYYIFPSDMHHLMHHFIASNFDSVLKQKLISSPLHDKVRLIIHDRFCKDAFFHKGEFVGVNYAYSGELRVHFPDKTVVIPEGHLCLIGKHIPHSYEIATENDIILSFQIDQGFFNKNIIYGLSNSGPIMEFLIETLFDKPHHYRYQVFDCSHDDKMNLLFEDLFLEYLDPGICSEALLESYIKLFFIQLARCQMIAEQENQEDSSVFEILKYMELNSKNCSLQALADEFNFNPKYISKLIKQQTGVSYSEYLTQIKLSDVCNYLRDTQIPIQEIAERCGYTNRNFFYKKFYEYYNMSPKEYRLQHQKKL